MRPSGTFNGSLASEGNDNRSRGSKQKIIQLKDELNGGSLQINPKFEKMKVLRESYEIAKFRANELLLPHDQNLYIKAHGLRASKIYSALSTLIFVSISCSKVEELEDYVMQSAAQVPSSIFDLEEWSSIVKIAKDCREGDSNSLRDQIATLKQNLNVYYQLSANPLKAAQMELKLLRSEVQNELGGAQRDLAGSINLIMQMAMELQSGTGSKQVQKINKLLHETGVVERVAEAAKAEELEALRETHKATLSQLMRIENEQAQMENKLNAVTNTLASTELQNAQLLTQVAEQAKEIEALKAAAAVSPRRISAEQQAQQVRDFQELYEQYNSLSTILEQRDQHIAALQDQLKGGSLKQRIDQDEPEVTVPQPPSEAELMLESQVAALTEYVTQLEHDLEQEKKQVKTLSTEVRLDEAARCEAVNFAEEVAAQLAKARDDIEALENEAAALREAMRTRNLESVCDTIPPSPRSSFITLSLTKFSPTTRAGRSFASFQSIEEGNEDVTNSAADSQKSEEGVTTVDAEEVLNDDTVQERKTSRFDLAPLVIEKTAEWEDDERISPMNDSTTASFAEGDKAILAAEAAHAAASALFLGTVHVAVMQDEFTHNPPHGAPAPAEAEPPSPPSLEDSAAEASNKSEEDSHLIADEAARIAHSAVFLGAVHVAVMQDEFAHNPPHSTEATIEPAQTIAEEKAGKADSERSNLNTVAEVEVEQSGAVATEKAMDGAAAEPTLEAEIPADETAVHEPLLLQTSVASLSVPNQDPVQITDSVQHTHAVEDAQIVAAEASRLANTALFLGTVHVAVMQDEFAPRARSPSPAILFEHPAESVSAREQSSESAAEPPVADSQATVDLKMVSAVATRVVASAVFGGAVRVAVQQHEFRHQALPAQRSAVQPSVDQSAPVVAAISREADVPVQSKPNVAADAAVIAAEAAHAAASALFLGTVHVAVMQDEFSHHAKSVPHASTVPEAENITDTEQSPSDSTTGREEMNEADVCKADQESKETEGKNADMDKRLIAEEAAHTAASAVFLGAVHVAVMQEEFAHHPPHADSASNERNAPPSASTEAIPSTVEVATNLSVEQAPPRVDTAVHSFEAEDKAILAAEAAHTAASALFLGTVHVAVMQDEFSHNPPHAVAEVPSPSEESPIVEAIMTKSAAPAENITQNNASVKVESTERANTEPASSTRETDSTTPSPPELVEVTELVDKIESAPQVSTERKPSTDDVIMPIRTRNRSSSGSKSVKFSQILTAVEIFETEPVNNSELWTPDPSQKTFSFEETPSTAESQKSESDASESVSGKDSTSEKAPEPMPEATEPVVESVLSEKADKTQIDVTTTVVKETSSAPETPLLPEAATSVPWTIQPAKDTEQGKHGWYNVNGQLCYYGSDKGEPLLLCGSVTEEVYNMAVAAESAAQNSASPPFASDHTVAVDRLGVRATRLQAEYLREEMLNLEHKHTQAVQELEEARALTEAELFDCQALVHTLHEEISQCKEIITHLEGDRRRTQLNHQQTERFNKKMATLSIEQVVALIKLTSITRGFLGRARVRRLQVSKLARESGILHAMANTKQGEAGWYMGPKGNIFYFAIKNGTWTTVAGPLTQEEFELMMLARKQKQVRNSQDVLTMCRVPLQPDWEALVDGGELYVANVSDKVFVCKPLDAVIAAAYPAPVAEENEPEQEDEQNQEEASEKAKAKSASTKEASSSKKSKKSAKLKVETASERSDSGRGSPVPVSPLRSSKGFEAASPEPAQAVDFNNPLSAEQQASVRDGHSPVNLSLQDESVKLSNASAKAVARSALEKEEEEAKGWRWQ